MFVADHAIADPEEARRRIAEQIDAANGRRRARTLDYDDAAQAMAECLRTEDRFGYVLPGDMVTANSYGYSSSATVIAADSELGADRVYVRAFLADGRKRVADYHDARHPEAVVMTRAVVRRLVREAQRDDRDKAAQIAADLEGMRDLTITFADSIDAGNCRHETSRIAAWFDGDSVDAGALIDAVAEREPALMRYVAKAVKHVASKAMCLAE